jgi:acetylornithine deacetylase/succinyl-diaminopimelate desuccinylase-like protein
MAELTPAQLLQTLIRFDTTNPPGDEAECVRWIDGLLKDAGFETRLLALTPSRPNLVTRLAGRGEAPPLLVHGHVDVVPTAGQSWAHPPFSGDAVDGEIWGRGALDMKGGVTMLLSALLRLKREGVRPPGDVILAVLSDEEAGSDFGARFLAERHAELFEGVVYAIGEGGGPSTEIEGRRVYQIAVDEKRVCWMRATLRGPGGHGSSPIFGGAMADLKRLLQLHGRWLPVHVTPAVRRFVEALADGLGEPVAPRLRRALAPEQTDRALEDLGDLRRPLGALLHNTVSVTTLRAGDKVNVIPSEIQVGLDGRLLPGFTADDMLAEIRAVVGDGIDIAVERTEPPGREEPDMRGFETLASIVRELDPDGLPVPGLVAGFTDVRQFAKLGIQGYGFLPMRLPAGFKSAPLVHAADERVPVESLEWGVEAITRLLRRFP